MPARWRAKLSHCFAHIGCAQSDSNYCRPVIAAARIRIRMLRIAIPTVLDSLRVYLSRFAFCQTLGQTGPDSRRGVAWIVYDT